MNFCSMHDFLLLFFVILRTTRLTAYTINLSINANDFQSFVNSSSFSGIKH